MYKIVVMDFVECTLCIGIKTMPVCISAHPCCMFLYPFLCPFLTTYSFNQMSSKTSVFEMFDSLCYFVTCLCWSTHLHSHCPVSSFLTPPPHLPCRPISLILRPALANHTAPKPGGGVKKVTGVGGTTYEISVWAAHLLHGVLQGIFGTPWSLDKYSLTELVNMNIHRPLKQNGYSLLQHYWLFGTVFSAGSQIWLKGDNGLFCELLYGWIQACLSNLIHCFTLGTLAHRIDHCFIPKKKKMAVIHWIHVEDGGLLKETNEHPLSEWTTCVLRSESLYSISLVLQTLFLKAIVLYKCIKSCWVI